MTLQKKIMLEDSELPKQWYNLTPDLPTPLNPPLGPDGKPITPEMLAPVFPMNLIEQEVSQILRRIQVAEGFHKGVGGDARHQRCISHRGAPDDHGRTPDRLSGNTHEPCGRD